MILMQKGYILVGQILLLYNTNPGAVASEVSLEEGAVFLQVMFVWPSLGLKGQCMQSQEPRIFRAKRVILMWMELRHAGR